MVRHLQLRIIDAIELEEHLEEVRLAMGEQARDGRGRAPELLRPEVLAIQHLLRPHQLLVELGQR